MKNFKLNTEATELDVIIEVPTQMLETLGWDFETFHENTSEAFGITMDEAREYNYNNYTSTISISGTPEDPKTLIMWYSPIRNKDTGTEETGDDQSTVNDIIELLNEGFITVDNDKDFSVNETDTYVPAFIES